MTIDQSTPRGFAEVGRRSGELKAEAAVRD